MAQSGYSPISLYYSTTASATPSAGNLVSGELAINITDGILFYKDNAGVVQTLATKAATSGTFTSITLSGGTANGVAYLNGSKVVTTGSALTFDGTTLGVNGGLVADANLLVQINSATGQQKYFASNKNGAYGMIFGYDTQNDYARFRVIPNTAMAFAVNDTEGMRLTSTGLGIGTSAPGYKLDVVGSINIASSNYLYFRNSDNTNAYFLRNDGASGSATGTLTFTQGGVGDRMRLDSSGNLGIGTSSPTEKLTVNGGIITTGPFNGTSATGGSVILSFSTGLGSILSLDPSVAWKNLDIGSAQTTFSISGSEKMRLDSSGNLGLGVTPSAWATYKPLQIGQNAISGTGTDLELTSNAYYNAGWKYAITSGGATRYSQQENAYGTHAWYTAASGTAGNAITFTQAMTLTANGDLVLGATSAVARLDVRGRGYFETSTNPTNGAVLTLTNQTTTSNNGAKLVLDAYNIGTVAIGVPTNDSAIAFYTGLTTERARIDSSGNLGIGTSSPSTKLHIKDSTGTAVNLLRLETPYSNPSGNKSIIWTDATDTLGRISVSYTAASGSQMSFGSLYSGGYQTSDLMVLSSSGNLGLGVTPSAWSSYFATMQLGSSGAYIAGPRNNADDQVFIGANSFYDTSYKYKVNGYATQYYQITGKHIWQTAPSGTAGNAISFTQAMTLDASGNLGVGTTSAAARLHVYQDSSSTSVMSGAYIQNFSFTTNSQAGIGLFAADNFNAKIYTLRSGSSAGNLVFATNGGGGTGEANVAERARIDSSGNLGVGITPIANTRVYVRTAATTDTAYYADNGANSGFTVKFAAALTSIGNDFNQPLAFLTNNTERARIDSSGNLLVGTTSTNPTNGLVVNTNGGNGLYLQIGHPNGTGSGVAYERYMYNQTEIGSITQNGTTGVLYNITSDHRLKDVVGAVTGSGERIDALKPVNYTWKSDGSAARGFLAHEFQEVYANSVTGTKDAVDEEGNPIYQQMQASTTEVIADLVAEIQSLRKRLSALEGK